MAVQQLGREQARRMSTEEMERELNKKFRAGPLSVDPLVDPRDRAYEKGNDMRVPQEGEDIDALGRVYKRPERKTLRVRSTPTFEDTPENVGFGPKGNIFASSKEQLEDYRKMYGGHGSKNAAAAQQLRDMGRESSIMRNARERVEAKRNPTYGGYEDERPSFDLKQLFGK